MHYITKFKEYNASKTACNEKKTHTHIHAETRFTSIIFVVEGALTGND